MRGDFETNWTIQRYEHGDWNRVGQARATTAKTAVKEFKAQLESGDMELFRAKLRAIRSNPSGTKGEFFRCVKAVEKKGGAYDPRAVCAAMERREYGQKELTRRAVAGKRAKARNPSDKQIGYALHLLDEAGYSTRYMNAQFKELGATMRERSGTVEDWLKHMNGSEISNLIGRLKKRTGNPEGEATDAYTGFHGHEPEEEVIVKRDVHFHEHLAGAGKLVKLTVKNDFASVDLTGFKGALLAFNEERNQLYIEGGDQSVDLRKFGIRNPHEMETLGQVVGVEYHTRKDHLGKEGGNAIYVHKFDKPYPDLLYDVRNEKLLFSGGGYNIPDEGIDH